MKEYIFYEPRKISFSSYDSDVIPPKLKGGRIFLPFKKNILIFKKHYLRIKNLLKKKKLIYYNSSLNSFTSLKSKASIKIDTYYFSKLKIDYEKWVSQDINLIRDSISKIIIDIPLYQELHKKIELVKFVDVYDKVFKEHYRIPDKDIEKKIKKNISVSSNTVERIQQKRDIEFLSNYNYRILNDTYVKVLSMYVTEDITKCKKPSFIYANYGIPPYYSLKEMIKLATMLKIIRGKTYHDFINKKINKNKLCRQIKKFDIPNNQIVRHHDHIKKNGKIDIVKYYSFLGDYVMNAYLRNLGGSEILNKILENNIKNLWDLILSTPSFSKEYTVYRFIDNDSHINHLQPGDIYTEKSFISSTRDPFYQKDEYSFGNIVIRYIIPKNKAGIALLLESYSLFPDELELLFAPLTKMKLVKRGWDYFHPIDKIEHNIRETYEFEILGNSSKVNFTQKYLPLEKDKTKTITSKTPELPGSDVFEKISYLLKRYVSPIKYVKFKFNGKVYNFLFNHYDASGLYQKAFYYKVKNGFMLSYQNPENSKICLILEIQKEIHVNYYMNFYGKNECGIWYSDRTQCEFLANVGRIFGISKVIIHPYIGTCDKFSKFNKFKTYEYNISEYKKDFIEYLENNNYRFKNIDGVTNNFGERLDKLEDLEIPKYVQQKTVYKSFLDHEWPKDLKHFIIFIGKYLCHQIDWYMELLRPYLEKNGVSNMFDIYYTLDVNEYLKKK